MPNWMWVVEMEVRGQEATPVEHTYQQKNMYVCAPFWLRGSISVVVELGWRGVTGSRELACLAVLHPRCGVVDISPGSCLKVDF